MNENFWEQAPLVDQPANKPAKNFWDDAPIAIDGMDATPAAQTQPESSGIWSGIGSGIVRSYQENKINAGIAEKFRLQGYKAALEQGGEPETEISDLVLSNKATPAQMDLLFRGVPRNDPVWKAAELARVTNEMGKLDLAIKDAEATKQNYPAKSAVYQGLQGDIEAAKKEGRPIMGTLEALWNNKMAVPEFVAEGAYGTAKPIAGAIGSAIALRRGKVAPLAQTLGPIAVSMGLTGIDSYKGEVTQIIEDKARQGGIDLRKNPEMISGLLQDANFIDAVKTDALKAGLNDAAWAGISTWLGMTPKIKGLWQPVIQSVAEAGTEASKQLVTKGTISDPSNVIMSGVAGAAFEGPAYGLHAAFSRPDVNPTAPGPQAQQAPAPTPVAPQPINADNLPSVAGETVEAPAAPAPVAVAPVQPELPVQPAAQPQAVAPAPTPVAPVQPAAPAPVAEVAPAQATPAAAQPALPAAEVIPPRPERPDINVVTAADYWKWVDADRAWYAKYGKTAPAPVATAQPEAKPATPVAPTHPVAKQQAQLGGMEGAFNLAGEQVAAPAEPVQAPTELGVERENPIASEARARLMKLEAAGKGDSDQAKALRRTIERESKPAQPAAQAAQAETTATEEPNVDLAQDKDVSDETKAALAKANADVMAAFKKYGKKSQQYKDAQKAKKKIFEKALAEKSKALEAERDDQPNPRTDAEISPPQSPQAEAAPVAEAGYVVRIGKREYKVGSLAEASKKWMDVQEEIDNQGLSWNKSQEFADIPNPTILDSSGKQIGWISQNGTIADGVPGKPKNKLFDPYAEPAAEAAHAEQPKAPEPVAEQPKKESKPANVEPTIKKAAKAQKTDQPQTKRARTALAKAIRENGVDDKTTKDKYRAVLRALEREGSRSATAKDVSQPYLGLSEPSDIKAARELLAKKAKKEGKIANEDARKANILIEQYEAEVDLAQGQLRDEGQIKLVSDETLNRVVEHVQGMLDDGMNPDADAMNAMRLAGDEIVRREQIDAESFGDPIADVKSILRKQGIGIPLLPVVKTEKGSIAWADTEYSGLKENLPKELSQAGGVFSEPQVEGAGIDLDRARNDSDYRKKVAVEAEGMMGKLMERMQELGWTQLQSGYDIIGLLSDAADGKPQVPEGGVSGSRFKGDPSTVTKLHSGDVDLGMLASEGSVNAEQQNVAQPEAEPTQEERQGLTDIQAEYENPPFDATPTPAEQAILDAASDNMPTEESILAALDKAAAERLDPKNRSSIGPDLIAAVMWQTARDIQKGVVSFAKWAADTARNFPSLKGSLKTIWAKAQDIAKRPIDYIRFRALDTIADKVWQNVRRNKGSATLRKIANIVFAKGGPDADAVDNDIPTRVNLVRTQFSNIYAGVMERFAADFADMTPEQRRQWDTDFRKHVIDGTTPSDPKLAKAVKDFRNLMRDLLAYQREAGIEMGDQGVNYFPRNYDPDAVEANRPGFVKAAIEMYRRMGERMYAKIMAEPITQEQIDTRAESLKDKDDKAGTTLRSDDEYKRIAEIQLEQTRQERADKYNFSPDDLLQKAEDWATAITHGDVLGLTLFKASEGKITSDATDARKFSNDEAKLADAFLKKNVDDIMLGYIDGAVRGAELARVFGEDGKMFEQMMNKLSKEGVDAETIKETRRLVQKALGVGREQASQATAVFFDWVNVVLAGAFLGKTAIYNLVLEPISFGIRTGNAYLALKSMADTWKYALTELAHPSPEIRQRLEAKFGNQSAFAKSVTETVGEQVGLIQREMERAYLNSHWDYSSGEKGSKMAKWISQRIYRANLMSATEKAKVQASIGIARLALRDNTRFLAGTAPIQKLFKALGFDTNAEKSAAVIMRENGVPEADHKAFAAFVEGLEGKTDAEWQAAVLDPKNKMAKHYRRALQRMSLGMSIKTNPALKMEMSDSVLGRMLMQLMNYSYAYSNLIKDRMYSMAAQTVAKDASKIDRLRYAAPLMVGAPLAILAAVGSKALISAMWPSDEMEEMNKKKAAARKAFDAASFAGMFGPKIEYLVKGFERGQTPGGPVAETVFRGGQAAFAAASDPESAKKIYNAKKQAYSSTVKPLVTGAGAAVHPFFGFLGNAAVNKQEVREAVIGDKPKK